MLSISSINKTQLWHSKTTVDNFLDSRKIFLPRWGLPSCKSCMVTEVALPTSRKYEDYNNVRFSGWYQVLPAGPLVSLEDGLLHIQFLFCIAVLYPSISFKGDSTWDHNSWPQLHPSSQDVWNNPTIGSYSKYCLNPNGMPRGNLWRYRLVYLVYKRQVSCELIGKGHMTSVEDHRLNSVWRQSYFRHNPKFD